MYKILLFSFLPLIKFLSKIQKKSMAIDDLHLASIACHRDVLMVIYSIFFLNYNLRASVKATIIDDGSMTSFDKLIISLFSNSIVYSFESSGKLIRTSLKKYKYLFDFRYKSYQFPLRFKLDAILLGQHNKTIYLDADYLCNKKPDELIDWVNSYSKSNFYTTYDIKLWNHKDDSEELFRKKLFAHQKIARVKGFNSGLLGFSRPLESEDLNYLNDVLALFHKLNQSNNFFSEERLFMLYMCKFNAFGLPKNDYVNICYTSHLIKSKQHKKSKMTHFAHQTKNCYYKQAFMNLVKIIFCR